MNSKFFTPFHKASLIYWMHSIILASVVESAPEQLSWHDSYEQALSEARASGKPIFLEFRCAPCINGREFDAQVVYTLPSSPRGKLLSQYVRARITSMTGIDIEQYDHDWYNSLYYFIINSNENIYLRYGGRDSSSADAYLNLESLELALRIGLEEHTQFLAGNRLSKPRGVPIRPADYRLLRKNIIEANRCVECHLVADFAAQEKELAGLFNPLTDLYQSPDIKRIGLHLDIPKGLLLAVVPP